MQTGADSLLRTSRPMRLFGLSRRHILLAMLLFAIEVVIATRLPHVSWVRAYLGDVLVVVLLYAMVRSVLRINDYLVLLMVFVFACGIEMAQYFHVAERLGYVRGDVMYTVIGNTFSWGDIVCYAVGCIATAVIVLLSRTFVPHSSLMRNT